MNAMTRRRETADGRHAALVVLVGQEGESLAFAAARLRDAGLTVATLDRPDALAATVAAADAGPDALILTSPASPAELVTLIGGMPGTGTRRTRTIALVCEEDAVGRAALIAAGADAVLVLPKDDALLVRTTRVAALDRGPPRAIARYIGTHKPAIGRLVSGVFEIRTLAEAERLATMLAADHPDPERLATGIWELLSNAVEHGNLEIDFAAKRDLLMRGAFAEEVERRLHEPPYADRVVRVAFGRSRRRIKLRIEDQGAGFDHAAVLHQGLPLDGPNGRGITIASRLCFDTLTYRGAGNVVEATVGL